MENAANELQKRTDALGLSIETKFVPFSQSRHADGDWLCANWKVTLKRSGREILTTDYAQGVGYLKVPKELTYTQMHRVDGNAAVREAIEDGSSHFRGVKNVFAIPPTIIDVFGSLLMDCDVLDAGGFTDWALGIGYDPDSRKAETIYRTCLEHALKLRAAIGDAELTALREIAHEL